jgi:hypothetical protein
MSCRVVSVLCRVVSWTLSCVAPHILVLPPPFSCRPLSPCFGITLPSVYSGPPAVIVSSRRFQSRSRYVPGGLVLVSSPGSYVCSYSKVRCLFYLFLYFTVYLTIYCILVLLLLLGWIGRARAAGYGQRRGTSVVLSRAGAFGILFLSLHNLSKSISNSMYGFARGSVSILGDDSRAPSHVVSSSCRRLPSSVVPMSLCISSRASTYGAPQRRPPHSFDSYFTRSFPQWSHCNHLGYYFFFAPARPCSFSHAGFLFQ